MERGARSQVIGSVDEFARYLRGLVGAVGDTPGWYAVFAERDPEGVRAWLDGSDVPPWDVVLALLQNAAAARGTHPDEAAAEPARRLHAAAVAAHDAAPGGEAALSTRLDALSRERRYAVLHERDVTAALRVAATPAEAERLGNELAWARDDRERAVARCAELQARPTRSAPAPSCPRSGSARRRPRPPACRRPAPRPRPRSRTRALRRPQPAAVTTTPPSPGRPTGPSPADAGNAPAAERGTAAPASPAHPRPRRPHPRRAARRRGAGGRCRPRSPRSALRRRGGPRRARHP